MSKPIVAHTTWDAFSWPRIRAKLAGKWLPLVKPKLPEEATASSELERKKARVRNGECWNGDGHDMPVAGQRKCRQCLSEYYVRVKPKGGS